MTGAARALLRSLLQRSVRAVPARLRPAITRVPLLAPLQRYLIDRYLSGSAFVHTIDAGPAKGLLLELRLPQDKAYWKGNFEPEFAQALGRAIRPGDVCYDVGGHRGYMSGVMALAGASRVVVFEPLPENLAGLRRLRELNPAMPLHVEPCALGIADGEAEFMVMPDMSMGKLASSPFQLGTSGERRIVVALSRLDTVAASGRVPPPDLIKIDVEGAEYDVLSGGLETLRASRPRLFIEAHSAELGARCADLLSSLGYDVRQLETGDLRPDEARHLFAQTCAG